MQFYGHEVRENENKTTPSEENDDAPQEGASHIPPERHTEPLERETVSGPLLLRE
jgi:hypothetical protein